MEKRNFYRTSLERDDSAQFKLDGQSCSRIQVTDISINGCRIPQIRLTWR